MKTQPGGTDGPARDKQNRINKHLKQNKMKRYDPVKKWMRYKGYRIVRKCIEYIDSNGFIIPGRYEYSYEILNPVDRDTIEYAWSMREVKQWINERLKLTKGAPV